LYRRIKHYISFFGEHVIGKEVESALQEAIMVLLFELMNLRWHTNYTKGLPYHEWFIEFDPSRRTRKLRSICEALDNAMRKQNMYYDDLIVGKCSKNWWLLK
jgi:hypothetical protein